MKLVAYIILWTLFITSCDNKGETLEAKNQHETTKPAHLKDSVVEIYTQNILEYHKAAHDKGQEIELTITGKRAYEDDSILILSFDEILKFGSWHYTNSSLCFHKKGRKLIPIHPSSDEKLLHHFFQLDFNYPNRVDGVIHQIIDLTGDGNPEYVFRSEGMVRDNFEEKYSIYQLNVSKQLLEREKFSISSSGILFSHPIIYGESRGLNIVENDTANPVIEVKEVISELADSYEKVNELSCTFSYYIWDDGTNQFVNLASRPSNTP